ncbi:MAG TPA: hypothetical protein ACFYEK_01100 [Candidatus Wunengus sp. YC60]|uniref:hypothetical protein n=1 Tax=Candidatus Wunengus sp. YC60 TaxID=3367697 RepID=UPI004026A0F1
MIYKMASALEIETITPIGVDHSLAGRSHQQALNKVWPQMDHENTIIIVDHDVFAIKEFRLFKEYDIASVMQGRGEHIKYFHPGIMIIHPSLKDRDQVDFTGDEIDGYRCDTGGEWHKYLQAHPKLLIKELSMPDIESEEFGDDRLQLCDDFLLHFRNGSGWLNTPREIVEKKKQKLIEMLGL